MTLVNVLNELCKRERIVLIFDEIQELRENNFFKLLAAIHDEYAPRLSVVLMGSIISIKRLLSSYAAPLHGRLGFEITLEPLDKISARKMLRKGFEECGIDVDVDLIIEMSLRTGGFPGWISSFGRNVVLIYKEKGTIDVERAFQMVISESKPIIFDELARAISERRNIRGYLKLLKSLAERGSLRVSEAAKIINKKPNTAISYLKYS